MMLTHIGGAQMMVNAQSLALHIQGDPERLVAEAKGALAALRAIATQSGISEDERTRLIVPVIRTLSWLDRANTQSGSDLMREGMAIPFGRSLVISFAAEYTDRRIPLLQASELASVKAKLGLAYRAPRGLRLLELAIANQSRMAQNSLEELIVTDLYMGDGSFFLRSKNLQAASLILQPFAWQLLEVDRPAQALVATIVSPEVVLFGPADPSDLETSAQLLSSAARGLRKSFGSPEVWGCDVFTWPSTQSFTSGITRLPERVLTSEESD